MKTPRSTALAERLIVWTAIIVLTWFVGYEWGRYSGMVEARAQCVAPKKLKLDVGKRVERRWINYWKVQS